MSTKNNQHKNTTTHVGGKQTPCEIIEVGTDVLFTNILPATNLGRYIVFEIKMSGDHVVVRLRKPPTPAHDPPNATIDITTNVLFKNHLPTQHLGVYTIIEISAFGAEDAMIRLGKPQTQ